MDRRDDKMNTPMPGRSPKPDQPLQGPMIHKGGKGNNPFSKGG